MFASKVLPNHTSKEVENAMSDVHDCLKVNEKAYPPDTKTLLQELEDMNACFVFCAPNCDGWKRIAKEWEA